MEMQCGFGMILDLKIFYICKLKSWYFLLIPPFRNLDGFLNKKVATSLTWNTIMIFLNFYWVHFSKTFLFQVQKLVFSKKETDKPQILGFITQSGIQKPLLAPLLLDNTTDFIACKLQAALQASFKEEIYQNFLGLKLLSS